MPFVAGCFIARFAAFAAAAAVALLTCVGASPVRFLEASNISEGELDQYLSTELMLERNGADMIRELEDALLPMFTALPKDVNGRLDHATVRYALHRLFVQRHGWYVKGLEPMGKARNASAPRQQLSEWVPSHVQTVLENRLGRGGIDLGELAALAATLEDAARREAVSRLEAAYIALGLNKHLPLDSSDSHDVIDLYALVYLHGGNVELSSLQRAKSRLAQWRSGVGFRKRESFLRQVQQQVSLDVNASIDNMSFPELSRVVEEIGKQYRFYDQENCMDLKRTLVSIEGSAGRVDLSTFYATSLKGEFIFRFNEKIDFLRDLGALDASTPGKPKVIIPNYVTSRPQCLESSSIYAVCCRDECEDLLGTLEAHIEAPEANVVEIVKFVSGLSSSSVSAPREIAPHLVDRLRSVADINDGLVPLHGRLFAQWMHHLFPRECPFPHEAGTTSPATADEWVQRNGFQSTQASEEEMVCHVRGPCAGGEAALGSHGLYAKEFNMTGQMKMIGLANASSLIRHESVAMVADIPWTDTEELLTARVAASEAEASSYLELCGFLLLMVGLLEHMYFKKTHSSCAFTTSKHTVSAENMFHEEYFV
eukprot:TRINITY_DN67_c0_g3_i1.p1 TRINITY_DN67_c0_g3~~TRINITY_DN67_c0_g3_i1.p1  ORF type:complete len:597 (-),score=114.03 TRINITY_DN67_c0_g3_i1:88-1878(-)